MILSPLLLFRAEPPKLVQAWRTSGYVNLWDGDFVPGEDVLITPQGRLSLRDGSLSPLTQADRATLPRPTWDLTPPLSAKQSLEPSPWIIFWQAGARSLRYRTAPVLEVAEFRDGSTTPTRTLRPSISGEYQHLSVDPKGRLFLFSSLSLWMSHEVYLQDLFVPPLNRTPLRFCRYYDISRPELGVLGVPIPPGKTRADVEELPRTPASPLACGDPYSGQIRWRNPRHERGSWIGKGYVLADSPYAILDGRTGKEVSPDAAAALGTWYDAGVRVLGEYVIVSRSHQDPDGWTTECFRLVE